MSTDWWTCVSQGLRHTICIDEWISFTARNKQLYKIARPGRFFATWSTIVENHELALSICTTIRAPTDEQFFSAAAFCCWLER
jgi:hypothetical protein